MITKKLWLILFLCIVLGMYILISSISKSQNVSVIPKTLLEQGVKDSFAISNYSNQIPKRGKTVDSLFYDVDGRLVCEARGDSGLLYWYPPVDALTPINVEFEGGNEACKSFLDSLYYTRWHELGEKEINSMAYYAILFDRELHIVSVHILISFCPECYDDCLKWMLRLTEGHWKKKNSHDPSKYYYAFGLYRFI